MFSMASFYFFIYLVIFLIIGVTSTIFIIPLLGASFIFAIGVVVLGFFSNLTFKLAQRFYFSADEKLKTTLKKMSKHTSNPQKELNKKNQEHQSRVWKPASESPSVTFIKNVPPSSSDSSENKKFQRKPQPYGTRVKYNHNVSNHSPMSSKSMEQGIEPVDGNCVIHNNQNSSAGKRISTWNLQCVFN